MDIRGRVAFITGGASGIGLATAKKFLNKGAKVVIYSRNTENIKDEVNGNLLIIEGDVSKREQVRGAVKQTIDKFGSLDILVNNAGVAQKKNFIETTEEDWDFIFDVNLKGLFIATQEALRAMGEGGERVIVNIASGAGYYGIGGLSIYCASKAAVINFTQSLSDELEGWGIRVVTVAPGSTDTKMFRSLWPKEKAYHTPEQVAEVIYKTIIGEIEPDDRLIVDVFHHAR